MMSLASQKLPLRPFLRFSESDYSFHCISSVASKQRTALVLIGDAMALFCTAD